MLKIEGALTYVEEQVAELQVNQNTTSFSLFLPSAMLSKVTTIDRSKKIMIVLDSLIFKVKINTKDKNKDILYNY